MTELSVVIVTWNTRDLAVSCIRRLQWELGELGAKSGIASEILVVDNGSTDGTGETLRQRFPGVDVIRLPENQGFAAGNNAAFRRASGRFVLLMNSDVEISCASLDRCVGVLRDSPRAGAVGPRLLFPDGRTQASVHGFPGLWDELVPRRWRGRAAGEFDVGASSVASVDALRGAALFVRREVIENVGPLCEDYFFFLEETDWCWRMREAGWEVLFVPNATATHQLGASSKRVSPLRTRIEFHRSLYRFVELRRGPSVARAVRWVRFGRALGTALLSTPAALFRSSARRRLRERVGLLRWHLRGRPPQDGLSGPGAGTGDSTGAPKRGNLRSG